MVTLNFINKMLLSMFSNALKKNEKFKNIHKGESCYIFGNGSSLKHYDLTQFNDRVSIGCGALFAHTDIKEINLKYYYVAHPLFFYNFWKNPYSGKYEKNKTGSFYRRKMKSHPNVQYFTSLSNYFGIQGENINYVYHFGRANSLSIGSQMDGVFTMMTGSLLGMIGMALYMGFKHITLVGCDYTSSPQKIGHFYESEEESDLESDDIFNEVILNSLSEFVDINSITIDYKYKGRVIPSVSYSDFTNSIPIYKENRELVSEEDFLELDSLNLNYKIS
jgi:hypothetical protein